MPTASDMDFRNHGRKDHEYQHEGTRNGCSNSDRVGHHSRLGCRFGCACFRTDTSGCGSARLSRSWQPIMRPAYLAATDRAYPSHPLSGVSVRDELRKGRMEGLLFTGMPSIHRKKSRRTTTAPMSPDDARPHPRFSTQIVRRGVLDVHSNHAIRRSAVFRVSS